MKKIIPALLSIFLTVSALGACDFSNKTGNGKDSASSTGSGAWIEESSSSDSVESVVDSSEESVSHEEESYQEESSDEDGKYTYNFTAEEKALFNEYFGFVIPFVENDEYYVEEYTLYYEDTDETEVGLNFYTFGNTKSEFNAYKVLFTTVSS